jgi:2-polyprenyl-3-methyl-5-hydroxy-6-metoxy-1,4-benzoquinol methylase
MKNHTNCVACDTALANSLCYTAREMMMGLQHTFQYAQCQHCGTIQAVEPPDDMTPYYEQGYYSFAEQHQNIIKRFLKRQRAQWALNRTRASVAAMLLGPWMVKLYGVPEYVRWMHRIKAQHNDAILDVGCGSGTLLLEMQNAGFVNLQGVDPFLQSDVNYGNGVQLFKQEIESLPAESFDVVMMHHALEHVPHPRETMKRLYRVAKPRGHVIIRVPVLGFAWQHYGVDWVQFDAPRHYFLPTLQALTTLAEDAGFIIEGVEYDSTAFQFWGSEQYRQNIALNDQRSFALHPERSIFSKQDIRAFQAQAEQLNEQRDGDTVCLYLLPLGR